MKEQRLKNKKLKSNNAITLIALIITIIILLILAMVSIKLIWDGGIITHTQTATSKYTIEQEKELIGLGYSNYKMAKINDNSASLTVEGAIVDGTNPWTITFNETGNRYKLNENGEIEGPTPKTEDENLLEKYLLGKTLMDVMNMDNMTFIDDPNSITDASTSVNCLNMASYGTDLYIYFKYGNAAYKLVYNEETAENKSVSLVYTPKGREGQKIEYSYDGTEENKKEWTILYDNGDNLEIVSPNTMGELTLGNRDEQAQGDTDIEKAIYSYNNAVTRINQYCSDLVTNSNKISVRSVGSNPNNPNEDNVPMYTSENLANWNADYNGRGKSGDINQEQDVVRMSYWRVAKSEDETTYLLASRLVDENSDYVDFHVGSVNSDGYAGIDYLWNVNSGGYARYYGSSNAVRPVVKINSTH